MITRLAQALTAILLVRRAATNNTSSSSEIKKKGGRKALQFYELQWQEANDAVVAQDALSVVV
jgi:hypothetical protein